MRNHILGGKYDAKEKTKFYQSHAASESRQMQCLEYRCQKVHHVRKPAFSNVRRVICEDSQESHVPGSPFVLKRDVVNRLQFQLKS